MKCKVLVLAIIALIGSCDEVFALSSACRGAIQFVPLALKNAGRGLGAVGSAAFPGGFFSEKVNPGSFSKRFFGTKQYDSTKLFDIEHASYHRSSAYERTSHPDSKSKSLAEVIINTCDSISPEEHEMYEAKVALYIDTVRGDAPGSDLTALKKYLQELMMLFEEYIPGDGNIEIQLYGLASPAIVWSTIRRHISTSWEARSMLTYAQICEVLMMHTVNCQIGCYSLDPALPEAFLLDAKPDGLEVVSPFEYDVALEEKEITESKLRSMQVLVAKKFTAKILDFLC